VGARILIVEDDLASRELARYLLVQAGHTVLLATNGLEGLRMAQQDHPDLVLSDIQLPGIGGLEIAATLHAEPGLRHVPVVAVTGSVREADRLAAVQAGFNGYISKPIVPENFAKQVAAFLKT
jgi:CheY-like chemotaxis protein